MTLSNIHTTLVRNPILVAILAALDAGAATAKLELVEGPSTVCATITFAATSFKTPASGSTTNNVVTSGETSAAAGTPDIARVKDGDGNVLFEGIAGPTGTTGVNVVISGDGTIGDGSTVDCAEDAIAITYPTGG